MKRTALAVLVGFLAWAPAAHAADVGRYQIVPGEPMLLLDTTTGKSWRYEAPGKWLPLEIVLPKPVPVQPKETTQQRWQRESDTRRLELNSAGPKPAEEKPAWRLLDKLLPAK